MELAFLSSNICTTHVGPSFCPKESRCNPHQ